MLRLVLFGAYGCALLYHIQSKKGKMGASQAHDGGFVRVVLSLGWTGN